MGGSKADPGLLFIASQCQGTGCGLGTLPSFCQALPLSQNLNKYVRELPITLLTTASVQALPLLRPLSLVPEFIKTLLGA